MKRKKNNFIRKISYFIILSNDTPGMFLYNLIFCYYYFFVCDEYYNGSPADDNMSHKATNFPL